LEGIGDPQTNSSEGIGNICKYLAHICQKVVNTLLFFARGNYNPLEQFSEDVGEPLETFSRELPL
jgi:hypothetical protein